MLNRYCSSEFGGGGIRAMTQEAAEHNHKLVRRDAISAGFGRALGRAVSKQAEGEGDVEFARRKEESTAAFKVQA
jgi:hypothetical protein